MIFFLNIFFQFNNFSIFLLQLLFKLCDFTNNFLILAGLHLHLFLYSIFLHFYLFKLFLGFEHLSFKHFNMFLKLFLDVDLCSTLNCLHIIRIFTLDVHILISVLSQMCKMDISQHLSPFYTTDQLSIFDVDWWHFRKSQIIPTGFGFHHGLANLALLVKIFGALPFFQLLQNLSLWFLLHPQFESFFLYESSFLPLLFTILSILIKIKFQGDTWMNRSTYRSTHTCLRTFLPILRVFYLCWQK